MHCPESALSFPLRLPAISPRRQVSVLTPSCLIVYYMNKNVLFIFTQKKLKKFLSHIFKIIGGSLVQKRCIAFSLLAYYDAPLFVVFSFFHFSFLQLVALLFFNPSSLNELTSFLVFRKIETVKLNNPETATNRILMP